MRQDNRSAEAWSVVRKADIVYVLCCSRCEGVRSGRAGMSVPAYPAVRLPGATAGACRCVQDSVEVGVLFALDGF